VSELNGTTSSVAVAAKSLFVECLGGDGSPLFILHGWGNCSKVMKPMGDLLKHHSKVYLVDLPGFGQSLFPEDLWNSVNYADCLFEYLLLHGIEKVSLLGHSFGGKVAMSFAAKYPNHIEKLTLIAPSGLKRKRSLREKCRLYLIRSAGKLVKLVDKYSHSRFFERHFSTKFGSKDYQNAGKMRPILVKSVNEDLTHEIKKIQAPTLLLWGEEDTETPPEIAHRLNTLIQQSTLHIFPGKDHHPYVEAGAHLCAFYILPFLMRGESD